MTTAEDFEATDLCDLVLVLRLARDGWPSQDWTTAGLASAVWNGFIDSDDPVGLTPAGEAFLAKVGPLYPERKAG